MVTRRTRNVSLTTQLDAFIDARVASGRFRSSSEVVRAALRLLAEAEDGRSGPPPNSAPPLPAPRFARPHEDALFLEVAEDAPAMLWIGDDQGSCVFLNRALRDFWGVAADGLATFAWSQILHPEDVAAVGGPFAAGMRDQAPFVAEGRYRHAAGGYRLLRTEAKPRFGTDGRFLGMVGINIDVTDIRHAEAARREGEDRLRDLVATLDLAAVLVRDLDGTIRFWSAGCERLYGWTAAEAEGRLVHTLLASRFPVPQAAVEAALLEEGQWQGDLRQLRRDGTPCIVAVQKSLRRDAAGRPVAVAESVTDVTTLRQTATDLRVSEERLRLAQEAGGIGIFEWDLASGRVDWSPEMFRLHDLDPATPPESLFAAWLERIHPEDRGLVEAQLAGAMAETGPMQVEFRITLPDGGTRSILARGVMVRDEVGQALRLHGVNMDISDLRRAEAKARESEAQHRALFDAAPFAIIVIDPATHDILDVNQRACDDYGYSRAEFLRLAIGDIDTMVDPEAMRARGRQGRLSNGAQEFEAEHRLRNGAIRDVLVRVVGVEVGGRNMTYGAHIDITDRKRVTTALRASEARLRLALEAAGFGTWEYDIRRDRGARKGLFANDFPGVPAKDFTLATWLSPVHPDDRPMVEARLRAVLERRSAGYEAEFRVPRPEGGWRWMASRGAVVETDPHGEPLTLAGIARDITESRQVAERQALLAREVDHRAKNVLAVVQAALRLTKAADLPSYIRAIEGRVAALARTQTLLAENQWNGAMLGLLLQGEIAPFAGDQRATLEGPAVALTPALAQALAMAIHELATNAVKHGALSTLSGRVRVAWHVTGDAPGRLHLEWSETGGPTLDGAPARRGFGSRVLEATLCGQLGGQVSLDWLAEGLVCRIAVPLARRGD